LPESLALIIAPQPPGYGYIEVCGIDNRTGRRVNAIILPSTELEDSGVFAPCEDSQETGAVSGTAVQEAEKSPPSVIFLPGDIYKPTVLQLLTQKVFVPRLAAAIILVFALLAPLWALYTVGTFYYLSDEDESSPIPQRVVWSTVSSPREVAMTFTSLDKADRVDVVEFGTTRMLNIVRSYPVSLTADGKTIPINVLNATVGEMLQTEGVEISDDDILSLHLEYVLEEDDELVIKRVTYKERAPVPNILAHGKDLKPNPFITEGREIVISDGVDGLSELFFLDRYVDGVLESSTLIDEVVVEEPVNSCVVIGDPRAAASTLEGGDYTDIEIVDGVPAQYLDLIPDAVCTAYSFGQGIFGASGMLLVQGFVATNPDIIPYGTLLYIASSRFTYGWAIAADCGTAMMEGYVDIDCYFDTYEESVMFGKKIMDVYIIGQLTQAQLEEYAANGMFYSRIPRVVENPE
ncbi:MAG: G5 domain-containing protein, partial [Oscillospiraceae bacterium]|nr:G5 domain-containing protein [Oscillospiraceae bacterium]